MLVNVHAAKCIGIEAVPILVEIEVGGGIGIHLAEAASYRFLDRQNITVPQ